MAIEPNRENAHDKFAKVWCVPLLFKKTQKFSVRSESVNQIAHVELT